MPTRKYAVKDTVMVSGEDVLLAGTKEIAGNEVDPEKEYMMNIPRYHSINHKRCMKRAYLKHGADGLIHYLKKYTVSEKADEMSETVRVICKK